LTLIDDWSYSTCLHLAFNHSRQDRVTYRQPRASLDLCLRPVSMGSFITLFPRLPCHLKWNKTWMKHPLSMENFIPWFHKHLIPRLIESW
jgi:hypothetical protein